jgi:hypothetical protein
MRLGATFEKRADWQPLSVVDGSLITGQNPASSTIAAQNVLNLLAAEKAAKVTTSIDVRVGSIFSCRPPQVRIVPHSGEVCPSR